MNYAEILTNVMRDQERFQPSFVPVRIVSVCDPASRQFLLVAVGWEGWRRVDNILFHAQLIDGQVIIETDLTEEGLKPALIEAGIRAEDFLSDRDRDREERERDREQPVQLAA
ncbi:MAG: element excision factor XisI family protein [Blastocatellia bacterium]